jgi:aspartate carbamoyltransferase regulatory subunit
MQDNNNNTTKNKSTLLTVSILASAIAVLSVVLVLGVTMMQQANAQNINGTSTSQATATTFQLTATQVNGTYLWVDNNSMYNPTLMLKANTDNTISVKSLQNDPEEHELIVQSWNNQTYTESEEIESGSFDEVLFNPGNNSSMKYHCEYHPDTMRGTIQVVTKS